MDDEEDIQFVFPPSHSLYCPICLKLFENPFVTRECGHSFCESCILQIENSACPLCRKKISLSDVHQNFVLNQLVKELLVYCKFKKHGCNAEIALTNKKDHEAHCIYQETACPHSLQGCKFKGSKKDLEMHLQVPSFCVYEMFKDYITSINDNVTEMRKLIEQQASEIQELKARINDPNLSINATPYKDSKQEVPFMSTNSKEVINSTNPPSPTISEREKWNISTLKCSHTLPGHTRGVTSLCIWQGSKDGEQRFILYSGSHDCTIRVWDLSTYFFGMTSNFEYKCLQILEGHKFTIWALVVSESGDRLFSGSSDGTIAVWDAFHFKSLERLSGHTGKIYTLEIKGNYLFSSGADRKILVWDISSLQTVHQLIGHTDCIWSLNLYNGHLFSGSDDTSVKIWNANTFDLVSSVDCDASKVLAVAADSKYIAVGTNDCKIKIYTIATYQHVKTLTEHSWEVWQLAIRDGFLFSGSFDHTIRVFDLSTFLCVKTLFGHKGYIHALRLAKHLVFSGSGDKTIKIWRGGIE